MIACITKFPGRRISSIMKAFSMVLLVTAFSQASTSYGYGTDKSVNLEEGGAVYVRDRSLLFTSKNQKRHRELKLPVRLRQALAHSIDVEFPEDRSLVINGHEYLLVVVAQASSQRPMGYCGAGAESTLYALQIEGVQAKQIFSTLVESCLKTIDLYSDGTKSPLSSISWDKAGEGFNIVWMTEGGPLTMRYRMLNGRFFPLPSH